MFRTINRMIPLLLAVLLAGCAAEQAYRDGKQLVAEDKVEAGLAKFSEAVAAEPGNAQYKIAVLQTRDAAVARWNALAETQAASGTRDAATRLFQQALKLEPGNSRAAQGLAALEVARQHDRLLLLAAEAIERKDWVSAKMQLDSVLAENATHVRARALLRSVNEARAAATDPQAGLNAMFQKPVSIQFRDAPLRQVFDVLAKTSGLNFVFDKDVKSDQRTTVSLKDSTIDLAVHFLLVTNQLERQVVGDNTVLIYPSNANKTRDYQELVVKTFYIANADAKNIAASLKTLFRLRDVVVDEKLNLIIMRDSREAVRLAEKVIELQDVAEPEVMLEVEILEVKRSSLVQLGIAWPSGLTLAPLTAAGGSTVTLADLRNLNESNISITTPTMTLNANKSDGTTNILANPRIRARNREKASILIGEKVPQITATVSPGNGGFASESVAYVDVGLKLNVEPLIFMNNEVAIKVALEVSNLLGQLQTKSGSVAYQIGTRQANTLLQLKDGENQVLAGLINNEDRNNGNKVPALGDLPLLGRLFGSTKDDASKTEIVLSITPRILRNIQRPQAMASEFSAGTDGSLRLRPDTAPARPALASPSSTGSSNATRINLTEIPIQDAGANTKTNTKDHDAHRRLHTD